MSELEIGTVKCLNWLPGTGSPWYMSFWFRFLALTIKMNYIPFLGSNPPKPQYKVLIFKFVVKFPISGIW